LPQAIPLGNWACDLVYHWRWPALQEYLSPKILKLKCFRTGEDWASSLTTRTLVWMGLPQQSFSMKLGGYLERNVAGQDSKLLVGRGREREG
jgi:hypothetical protein